MLFQARIIADSIAPSGVRLVTMLETHPAIVHQDMLTHRSMYKLDNRESIEVDSSKSTNSNRARTTRQILMEVWRTPFCPRRFPKRAASMHSSKGYHRGFMHHVHRQIWLKSRYLMIAVALLSQWLGLHKQLANRLVQPWQWVTMVMTGTDVYWEHFFTLRDHFAAQEEVQVVAGLAHAAYKASKPERLEVGDWHLPFVSELDKRTWPVLAQIELSVARCARTSYSASTERTVYSVEEDFNLYRRLAPQTPEHAGPREHQAQARDEALYRSGNLWGWDQLRHSQVGQYMLGQAKREQALAYAKAMQTNLEKTEETMSQEEQLPQQ